MEVQCKLRSVQGIVGLGFVVVVDDVCKSCRHYGSAFDPLVLVVGGDLVSILVFVLVMASSSGTKMLGSWTSVPSFMTDYAFLS